MKLPHEHCPHARSRLTRLPQRSWLSVQLSSGFFLSGLFLTVCSAVSHARGDAPLAVLGVLLPLSGQFAELGEECRWGVEAARVALAEREAPTKIRFEYEDSQSDAKAALSGFRQLLETKRALAILLIRSPVGLAVNPLAKQAGVAVLGAAGHPQFVEGNSTSYQFWSQTEVEGDVLAHGIIGQGGKHVAMLTADDDWLSSLSEQTRRHVQALGGSMVLDETIRPSDLDFSAWLTKAKIRNADTVFLNLTVPQIGVAVKKLRELGLRVAVYSNFWASFPDVMNTAGEPGMEGVFFPEMQFVDPEFRKVVAQQFPGAAPTAATYGCYTAAAAAVAVLGRADNSSTRGSIADALSRMTSVPLLDKTLPMKDRRGQYAVRLKRIHHRQAVDAQDAQDR